MPRMPKVPRGGGGESPLDKVVGIYEVYQVEDQVREDTAKYGISIEESKELRKAYMVELDTGGSLARSAVNWAGSYFGVRPQRASWEIIEGAKRRKERLDENGPSSRPPSITDYYNKK